MPPIAATKQVILGYSPDPRAKGGSISNPTVTYESLADGVNGTFQTLDAMAMAVRGEVGPDYSGWRDLYNKNAATLIINNVAAGSEQDTVTALFNFTRDNISYRDHPWNMQVVRDCRRTVELSDADCVSKSVCLATLLACRGFISRFVAQCPDGGDYDHVYIECEFDGRWLALDPTADGKDSRPFGNVGWFRSMPDYGCESTYKIFEAYA